MKEGKNILFPTDAYGKSTIFYLDIKKNLC